MTTNRNGPDGAEVFAPVIGRLREELASFERQAAATRALIDQLLVRAGADPPRAKVVVTKTRDAATAPKTHRASRPAQAVRRRRAFPQRGPANSATTAQADAKELVAIVSTVAAASERLAKATRSKDVAGIKAAVSAIATAERRGGELLVKLDGRLRPLPIGHTDRKRYRQAAARSAKAFAAKLQRDVANTLARINVRSPAKQPQAAPSPPRTVVSAWRQDADGGLVRTVGAVAADKAAAAHAGAA